MFFKLSNFCQGYLIVGCTKVKGKIHYSVIFATRVYPCFTKLHVLFYVNNKKIVPLDLYNLLDYTALAYWIKGDGAKHGTCISFQTQSYTVKDCVFIISIFSYGHTNLD